MTKDSGYQAEQRALGALLIADDPRAAVLASGLNAELFADPAHRCIFEAALRCADADEFGKAQTIDVFEDLLRGGLDGSCGGLDYLHALAGGVVTARNFANDVDRMRSARVQAKAIEGLRHAADKIEAGGDLVEALDGALDVAQTARSGAGERGAMFKVVPVADLASAEPPPVMYWWDGYMPAGVVTMLGAHGGAGKSTVALALAVCIAMGMPLFGVATRRGAVAYFSGEDPEDLIRFRLRRICTKLGVDPAELDGRLYPLDATAFDPVLFHEITAGARRMAATTPAYAELRAFVAARDIDVLIVDNASDTFEASEIDRSRVRAFMRALARIAQDRAGAVLLLAHVDKGTSRGDRTGSEGYSGSTAWHNSARSRLYLTREKDGGLRLEHQKSNLGRMREPLTLEWPEGGIPQAVEGLSPTVQGIADRNDIRALLGLLHEFYLRGEFAATSTNSPANVARMLAGQSGYPKRKPGEVFDLLRDAERKGLIERQAFRNADRKERERWGLTRAGCDLIGRPAPSAPSAPSVEHGATGAGGAPSAPTPAWGVRGGGARTDSGAEVAQ